MKEGGEFLHKKYRDLHSSQEVESAMDRAKKRAELGSKIHLKAIESLDLNKPKNKIEVYLSRFKEILDRKDEFERKKGLDALRKILSTKLTINPDELINSDGSLNKDLDGGFLDSRISFAKQVLEEQGMGADLQEIPEETLISDIQNLAADQRSSLNNWLDYLTSKDADDAGYPDWARYWVLRSISELASYDKEKKRFPKRYLKNAEGKYTKNTTVSTFPELNRESLAVTITEMRKKIQGEDSSIKIDGFEEVLNTENFAKIYSFAIENIEAPDDQLLQNIKGVWITYPKGSDHIPLIRSLDGQATGWCTAAEDTAKTQLENGDFHVYYSYDENGKATIPRIAIRMQDNQIVEVRGRAEQQNLDQYISPVLEEKLKAFPDGKLYQKKSSDMKMMTDITKRFRKGEELTKEDLKFLYEINNKIEGFGYIKDPRIEEIITTRNIKSDLSLLMGCLENEISLNNIEALSGNIKYHYGDLNLYNLTSAKGLTLPSSINGDLDLHSLTSAKGLTLPSSIKENLYLNSLTSADKDALRKKYPQYASKIY